MMLLAHGDTPLHDDPTLLSFFFANPVDTLNFFIYWIKIKVRFC